MVSTNLEVSIACYVHYMWYN